MKKILLAILFVLFLTNTSWGAYCNSCPEGANQICESPDGTSDGMCGWTIIDGGNGDVSFTTSCDNTDALGCTDITMTNCISVIKTGTDNTDQFAYKLLSSGGLTDVYIQFYVKMMTTPTLPSNGTDWGIIFLSETVNDPQSTPARSSPYFGIYRNTSTDYRWAIFDIDWDGETWNGGTHALGSSSVSMNGSKWYGIRMHVHDGATANQDYIEWWIDDGPDGTWHQQTSLGGKDFEKHIKYLVIGDNDIVRPFNAQITGLKVSTTSMPADCTRSTPPPPGTQNYVEQYGFRWNFDSYKTVGQFVNGDWWVVGPVNITSITPDWDGSSYGWEVNPGHTPGTWVPQGFQSGCTYKNTPIYPSKVPTLPYLAQPGTSIVKTSPRPEGIGGSSQEACIQAAAVLTVLGSAPTADAFRPAYVGTDKTLYYYSNVKTNLLPNLAPVDSTPGISWVINRFKMMQINHLDATNTGGDMRRAFHAYQNFGNCDGCDYQPTVGRDVISGIYRLMINDPDDTADNIKAARVAVLQMGIDWYYNFKQGYLQSAGGGYSPGELAALGFFGALLGSEADKTYIKALTGINEKRMLSVSRFGNNDAIYGSSVDSATNYWTATCNTAPTQAYNKRDPYGYIDSGMRAGVYTWDAYQFIQSPVWKGEVLIGRLIPEIETIYNFPLIFNYVDRYVSTGLKAQPDPCAPCGGTYGTDYGQAPTGYPYDSGCILDPDISYYTSRTNFACKPGLSCGRFPSRDDINADGTNANVVSVFQTNFWNAYAEVTDDVTNPSVDTFDIPSTSSSLTVPITTFVASDNIGVAEYLVKETATTPSSSDSGWTSIKHTSYVFTTAGAKTLYAWAKDTSGNISSSKSDTVTITLVGDETSPVITITSPTADSTYITSTSTITLSGTASDAVGVVSVTYTTDRGGSGSCTGTTSWTCSSISLTSLVNNITVRATDLAGNFGTDIITVTYSVGTPGGIAIKTGF